MIEDDPDEDLMADLINRQLLDLISRDPGALDKLLAQNVPGDLRLWLQDTTLTEGQADELRSFILSLKPRACLVQPDVVDVFGIDEGTGEQIITKLRALGVGRVRPIAPDPADKP